MANESAPSPVVVAIGHAKTSPECSVDTTKVDLQETKTDKGPRSSFLKTVLWLLPGHKRNDSLTKMKKAGFKKDKQHDAQARHSLRHENKRGRTQLDQVLRVGDIMRILRNLVDHVILVVGQPRLNAVIITSEGISVDVWIVPTLESASNLDHCDVTEMFMIVDLSDENKIKIVAQSDPADIDQWEPVAVFLSPFPASDIDQDLFAECVDKVVLHKQVWSQATAVNAVVKSALIEKQEYSDDKSRAALINELKTYWESDPICTTMPIRVWQMYIVKSNKNTPEEAGDKILRFIPAKCDRCLPSELWDILEKTSAWVEMREANFHTTSEAVKHPEWMDDPIADPHVAIIHGGNIFRRKLRCCRSSFCGKKFSRVKEISDSDETLS